MPSPLFDLTGKVAVVTGSSKGIGKAIAMHLALAGAKVVVSSRKAPVCEEAAAEIRKAGGEAIVIPCNISDKAQVEKLIAETQKQLGPVDVLVCNAASNPYYGPNEKLPDDVFMKVMQNNILSNMWLINHVPARHARQEGRLDHDRVVDRRRAGQHGDRRLLHLQGGRHAARAQPRRRVRARQHPRQHHRARPDRRPTSPARCTRIRRSAQRASRRRRCAASASPTTSPALAVMLAGKAGAFITGQTLIADGGTCSGG